VTPHHAPFSDPTSPAPPAGATSRFDWRHVAGPDEEDENDHISNVSYVRWIQDAARAHSDSVGWDRAAYVAAGGTFIVKRHEVDYMRPCHAGDSVVVTTWIDETRPASAVRRTRVVREQDGACVLLARTEWVFVAGRGHRPTRIPAEVLTAFGVEAKTARSPRPARPAHPTA
jgi:acyl-CoA thioester hydrolase